MRSGDELLEDEEEMTEAFRLSSARVGVVGCVDSGDGVVSWSLSMRGWERAREERNVGQWGGDKEEGRNYGKRARCVRLESFARSVDVHSTGF